MEIKPIPKLTPFHESLFWYLVDRGEDQECWPWTGHFGLKGYGIWMFDDRRIPAHRVAWSIANGPVPAGLYVCHKCDNPPCCNPAHLFAGTPLDNVRDMIAKGRAVRVRGEKHGCSKLTARQVRQIRKRYATGKSTHRIIASAYGVSNKTISNIITGKNWK